MKTIIAGTRTLDDASLVDNAVRECGWSISEVVSGCCRGVDALGSQWADRNSVPVVLFPADWDSFGTRAGPLRNREMARYADALILIWDGKSKGSSSMLNFAFARNLWIFEVVVKQDGSTRSRLHGRKAAT